MNIVPVRNILVHQVTSESHDPSSPPTFLSVWSWGKMLTHTHTNVCTCLCFILGTKCPHKDSKT